MRQVINNAGKDGVLDDCVVREYDDLQKTFPYLQFSKNDRCLHETVKSGYLNPRMLIMAQSSMALNQGCDVLRDTVVGLVRENDWKHRVITAGGRIIHCKRVLLATNVFTVVDELLGNIVPSCSLMPQTVCLLQISKSDAERLRYQYIYYSRACVFR